MRSNLLRFCLGLGLVLLIGSSGLFAQAGFIKGTVITGAGEENRSFTITDANDIDMMRGMLTNLPPAAEPAWPQFGFRGYGLQNQGISSFPSDVHVFQGVVEIFDDFGSTFFVDEGGLESFLAQKAGISAAHLAIRQMLSENMALPVPGPSPSPTPGPSPSPTPVSTPTPTPTPTPEDKPLPKSGSEPPYEPDKWNKAGVIDANNCYAYATNVIGKSFPRPGRGGGKEPPKPGDPGYNCANFIAAAESDGLVKADCDKACPKGSFKVALVIDPTTPDYHWYRQDDNGNWSHKPGSDKATNKDAKGNPIVDPRTADRGPYTTFCACFCVDPTKITIK